MADLDSRYEERRRRWEEKMERRRERWERRWSEGGRHHSGSGGLIIGVILAGIGIILLLQNLGILYVDDLWKYWPVILIVVGMSRVATACATGGRIWGAALAVVGAIFLLDNFDIIHGNVWNYLWPVVLIAIGVGMLVRGIDRGSRWDWWNPPPPTDSTGAGGKAGGGSAAAGSSSSGGSLQNTLNEWAFFGGVRRRIDAQDFEGGDVLAIFGGIRIDMERAGTKKEEVRIEANAMFGGIDFRVPDTWAVTVRGTGIFGGYEDKTIEPRPSEGKPPHLIISGVAMFGGVTVKN
ncbi:MAG TPA: DUF5668 domain-containing protein [Bryobacteraceae bacterium]|nr:DUF5668 domain-containing protein [Bryobacteraceae bacterium]